MAWFSRTSERRGSHRYQAEVPLVISVVGEEEIASLRALADGISEGGLSVSGLQGLDLGERVSLEVRLPNATHSLWVEAVVRHQSGYHGLQFLSLTPAQKQLIRRYCRLQPRQKVHPRPR